MLFILQPWPVLEGIGTDLKFDTFLNVRGAYIWGPIFRWKFVLVGRRLIFGGLIFEILQCSFNLPLHKGSHSPHL